MTELTNPSPAAARSFLRQFFVAVLFILLSLSGFVTWMDPFRTLNLPWSSSFVSDRNVAYRRFKLLETAPRVTDLIVGSSTSEVFVPAVLKERFGANAFMAGTGGGPLPVRYLMIKQALRTHPELKRIIYVADLFEFKSLEINSEIANQSEMTSLFDEEDLKRIKRPPLSDRFNDVLSYLAIDRSIRTLKDWLAERAGNYSSAFHADGSTSTSMILKPHAGEPIEKLAQGSATGLEQVYGTMSALDQDARWLFRKVLQLVEAHPGVELHLVIAPLHEVVFRHYAGRFERSHVFTEWVGELRSAGSHPRVRLHDYSYPHYLQAGIGLEGEYWHDGVHFSSQAMLKMASAIF